MKEIDDFDVPVSGQTCEEYYDDTELNKSIVGILLNTNVEQEHKE